MTVKLFRLFTVLAISLTFVSASFAEQSFEDFLKEQQQEFQQFKDERDKEFTKFLEQQWSEFKGKPPVKQIEKPKPVVFPKLKPQVKPDENIVKGKPVDIKPLPKIVEPPKPKPVIVPLIKIEVAKPKPEPKPKTVVLPKPEPKGDVESFNFFSNNIKFSYDPGMSVGFDGSVNNKSISEFWKALAMTEFDPLVKQLNEYKKNLNLSGWGYFMFVDNVAERIMKNRGANEKTLLTWFLLVKSGYNTKIAYRNDQTHLLIASDIRLFGVTYFTFGNQRFYALSATSPKGSIGSVYTYKKDYPGADKKLDFRVNRYPYFTGGIKTKTLRFSYGGKNYKVNTKYNINSVDYFKYHPQSDIRVYTTSYVPNWMSSSMLADLREIIKGKSEKEAANILLRFTQTAFSYKTDPQQFGREKFLFPEETVHYPYSDCEDRSIMYTYLVRTLLGLDTVILDYPGHIATAVKFNEKVKGDNLVVNGVTYTICDPTFINADIGREMPRYSNVKPKVIKF